jgi:RNA polymerase sigma-70 factor (ECF subfamily)
MVNDRSGPDFSETIRLACVFISRGAQLIATPTHVTVTPLPKEFERIFLEHSEFVLRTAQRITGNEDDAEDVLQTLFLRLLSVPMPPAVEGNPRGYLYRAAVNLSLNVIRSRKRVVVTEDTNDLERYHGFQSPDEPEIHARLREAIARLDPKAVEILVLRYVHGYTDAEIGKLLGASRGGIAVSLFRTRARLRKFLKRGGKL